MAEQTFQLGDDAGFMFELGPREYNAESDLGDTGFSMEPDEGQMSSQERSLNNAPIVLGINNADPMIMLLQWDLYLDNAQANQLEAIIKAQQRRISGKASYDDIRIKLINQREPMIEPQRSRAMKGQLVGMEDNWVAYWAIMHIQVIEYKREYFLPGLFTFSFSAKELRITEPITDDEA